MGHRYFVKTLPFARLLKQNVYPFPNKIGRKTIPLRAGHICMYPYSQMRGKTLGREGYSPNFMVEVCLWGPKTLPRFLTRKSFTMIPCPWHKASKTQVLFLTNFDSIQITSIFLLRIFFIHVHQPLCFGYNICAFANPFPLNFLKFQTLEFAISYSWKKGLKTIPCTMAWYSQNIEVISGEEPSASPVKHIHVHTNMYMFWNINTPLTCVIFL